MLMVGRKIRDARHFNFFWRIVVICREVVPVAVVIIIGIISDGSSVAVFAAAAPLAVPCGRSFASAKG